MKKLTVLLAVLFATSLAYAGDTKSEVKETKADAKAAAKDAKSEAKAEVKGKTHEVEAEIVSVDSTKNTITVKGESGEHTAPLEGKAIAEAKAVKPGQKVTLVCLDDEKGDHKAVTQIKTSSATSKTGASTSEKPATEKK
jgi:hypothetical protein